MQRLLRSGHSVMYGQQGQSCRPRREEIVIKRGKRRFIRLLAAICGDN